MNNKNSEIGSVLEYDYLMGAKLPDPITHLSENIDEVYRKLVGHNYNTKATLPKLPTEEGSRNDISYDQVVSFPYTVRSEESDKNHALRVYEDIIEKTHEQILKLSEKLDETSEALLRLSEENTKLKKRRAADLNAETEIESLKQTNLELKRKLGARITRLSDELDAERRQNSISREDLEQIRREHSEGIERCRATMVQLRSQNRELKQEVVNVLQKLIDERNKNKKFRDEILNDSRDPRDV